MPMRKVLLRAMLWSLGLAAAAGVLAVLTGGEEIVWYRIDGMSLYQCSKNSVALLKGGLVTIQSICALCGP